MTSPEKRERTIDLRYNDIEGMMPTEERRQSPRVSGHDLWLQHNALLAYVGILENAGDRMANILDSGERPSESADEWYEARKSAPKETK
jgi:hypothetical protein